VADLRRRKLLIVALAPLAALGQQPNKVWRVGFLLQRHLNRVDADPMYGAFTRGLRELGYVEGKNLAIEWRSAEGNSARLAELAAELVRLKVDVLVTPGTPASRAAQKATATIPIVMIGVGDPVGSGLVRSLARPGGNTTGLSVFIAEVGPKYLELLRSVIPRLTHVGILLNPTNTSHALVFKGVRASAETLGVTMQPLEADTPQRIADAFAAMARESAGALIVAQDALFIQQKAQIAELAAKRRLPSIGGNGDYVEAGGLLSYGQNLTEGPSRAAAIVDRILKGADPRDMPVEQATKFELVINLRTASVLGIKIPESMLLQATKVIE
jgi:putative ABC transport system substrate-binding protein